MMIKNPKKDINDVIAIPYPNVFELIISEISIWLTKRKKNSRGIKVVTKKPNEMDANILTVIFFI